MNTKHMGKRLFAMLLCLTMVLSVVPVLSTDAACDHGGHFIWTSVPTEGDIPAKGSVVLDADMTLDTTVVVSGDLHLCLHGHSITGTADPFFLVEAGARLTICDCKGEGTIGALPSGSEQYTAALNNGYVKVNNGKLVMNGGMLVGNNGKGYWGGAVQLINATFVMNGGTITGNAAKGYGGAVSLDGDSAFLMNDGTISNNSGGNGGAIGAYNGCSLITINGGTISGNYASEYGGAIYCMDGEVKINDGYFVDNVSVEDGGAFYVTTTESQNKELKVLALGNETTRDTLYYLGVLGAATGTPITVGYLNRKEAVLRDHDKMMETNGTYQFFKTDASGKLVKQAGVSTIPNALASDDWDVIILQNGILHAGVETTFNSDLEYMVDFIEDKAPFTKLFWNMTWALEDNTSFSSLGVTFKGGDGPGYNGSQALMYNYIIKCLDRYIVGAEAPYSSSNVNNYGTGIGWGFDGYLYTGAAIQKLRQQTGTEPTRDGVYLSGTAGRVAAAVAALKALVPSTNLNELAKNEQVITAVNAIRTDTTSSIVSTEKLTAETLATVVNAVKAAAADVADGLPEKVEVPASAIKSAPPDNQVTSAGGKLSNGLVVLGREDGPTRLRFGYVQAIGDQIYVIASRGIGHNIVATDESNLHFGGNELVVWSGKANYTSEQWQQSYENALVIDGYKLNEWGAVPMGGTMYDRYQAAQEGRTGYILGSAGDNMLTPAKIDMDGDGVKEDVLLLTFWSNYFKNTGNGDLANPYQDARATWITYTIDGGKSWAKPQALYQNGVEVEHGLMKHGDTAVFNDGNILVPFYLGSTNDGVTALAMEYQFDTAAKKWVQVGDRRPITRPQDSTDEYPSPDGWNEPTVVSPDGSDTVYAMARRTGHVMISHDRGVTWEMIANEPGFVAQPRFTILADDLLIGSWQITTGDRRGGVSKLFYTDADWTDTQATDVYVTGDVGGDLGDQSTTLLSDGRIFTSNYDVRYNAIVGRIIDPLGADFEAFKPIEVGMDKGEETFTLYTASSAPYTAERLITGSHTVSADVKFKDNSSVTIHTSAGDVTVARPNNVSRYTSVKVSVSVVGNYMYARATYGGTNNGYDSGWMVTHGDGNGTKTGIEASNATVSNIKVTRQAIVDVPNAIAAVEGDAPRQLEDNVLPALGNCTFTSSNDKVAAVSDTGLVTFGEVGTATITATIADIKKVCTVTVRPKSAEITGEGTTTVIHEDNFDSYSVGAKFKDVAASGKYTFRSEDKTVIAGDNSNNYLKLPCANTNDCWFAVAQSITGDYTARFDVKFDDRSVVYANMWQGDSVDFIAYFLSWGLKIYYTDESDEKVAVPEGTTSSYINYGVGSDLATTGAWMSVKMVRTEGSIYIKTWKQGAAEPAAWTFKMSDPVLKVSNAAKFTLYGNRSGTYYIDNLKITKQS